MAHLLLARRSKADVFDYIEIFDNLTRKHRSNGRLSPVDYETKWKKVNEAGVEKTRGITLI